ncbi:MAG: hypothetical protein A2Y17_02980 [Clostridiales bacterium GWF2_38_85]|nr:MAG: hypothetical protein A2Y17_02980 [Clostridiales bacterium GWF2_38_85]
MNLRKIISFSLATLFILTMISGCQDTSFKGGKEAFLSDEYDPTITLGDLFSGEKFEKISNLVQASYTTDKVEKTEAEVTINNLQISDGVSLNNSNSVKLTSYLKDKQMEGSLYLSLLDQTMSGKYYINDENVIVEFPDMLEKYIVIPNELSGLNLFNYLPNTSAAVSTAASMIDLPSFIQSEEIVVLLNDLVIKLKDLLIEKLPEENFIDTKETIDYNGEQVEVDVITLNLDEDTVISIFVDYMEYIRDNEKISSMIEEYYDFIKQSSLGTDLPDTADEVIEEFKSSIDDLIEQTNSESEESENEEDSLKIVVKYLNKTIIGMNLKAFTDANEVFNLDFSYISKENTNEFTFSFKDADDTEGKIVYTENTTDNEYTIAIDSNENGELAEVLKLVIKKIDEDTYKFDIKVSQLYSYENDDNNDTFEMTITLKFIEATDNSMKISMNFKAENFDFDVLYIYELLDSYEFNIPEITTENSYDVSDEDSMMELSEAFSENFSGFTDIINSLIGNDEPIINTDLTIVFDETETVSTEGELSADVFANVFDGNGSFSITSSTISISSEFMDSKINYSTFDMSLYEYLVYYFDGEKWYSVDQMNSLLIESSVDEISTLPIYDFSDPSFVKSGKVYVNDEYLSYEEFLIGANDLNVCFIYDNSGSLLYFYCNDEAFSVYTADDADETYFDFTGYSFQ